MNQIDQTMQYRLSPSSVPSEFQSVGLLVIALIGTVGFLCAIPAYRRYTGLTYGQCFRLWGCALGLAIASMIFISTVSAHGVVQAIFKTAFFAILLFLLAVPFSVQLYRKWIGGHLTDAEKLPGMDGVRAWFGAGNFICAFLIPVCAWQAFGISLPAMFVLTVGLLLAYPVFNIASTTPPPAPATSLESLSSEREKVLQLLEAGKITADESAELLNALGQSVPQRPQPASEMDFTPQRKIVLLGAALLLIGFFLPWFAINPGAMMNEMASQFQQNMSQMMPGNGMPQMNLSTSTGTVQVHAGDVAHGLGWWILALGLVAAVLPFFATNLTTQMQKKVVLAALGIGVILLVYLLSDTLRYVSIGAILALAGYALEVVGTLKEPPVTR